MKKDSLYSLFLLPVLGRKDSTDLAFCINGEEFSYSQLYDAIEQICSLVSRLDEDIIGLYATDDIRTYAAIIALWISGKSYLPLNPSQPKERHIEVISSVHSHYILSCDPSYDMGMKDVQAIYTTSVQTNSYSRQGNIHIAEVPETTLAYILFTSGSTGKPKGVQISRGNVAAFIDSMNHTDLDITAQDRCLQPFDFTFDISVSGYVIPLIWGASIYTIPTKAIKFTHIAMLLEKYHLTILQMVPSMIRNLIPYLDEVELGSIRYNILAGEALTSKLTQTWHSGNPEMIIYNMYGPTENTVFCTYYKIDKSNINKPICSNDVISIGKSFCNSRAIIVDENDTVIEAANIEGELCLSGQQLTSGYWENDYENERRFFYFENTRFYRTGDLCHYDPEKNIMYVGRKDFQVKINGFRVELGEIESRYNIISKGKFAIVMPFVNEQDNTELAIIIEGDEYDYKKDKQQLADELPAYEVPSKWLFIRNIPLNTNGKVDRKTIKQHFNL